MFRKILSVIFAIFMFLPNIARGAEMVNVEYIHQYLNTRWGIDLPYSPELTNPRVAANMKYLLTVIDIANEFLNNEQTTDYGNGEYATLAAADTVATNTAIDTLVKAPTFTITTTPNTSSFSMIIGAAGNFIIDWGDGKRDVIANKPIGTTTYSHKYTASGEYEIKLSGRATDYSDAAIDPDTGTGLVITFALTDILNGSFMATNVAKISGGLGRVFPTMNDGTNPNFAYAFMMAPITEIPADLFAGIQGAPAPVMFTGTFFDTAITEIPADLFAGIQGTPAERMFLSTFSDTAITSIPANLFGTLNGNGAPSMFAQTFYGCENLTTVDGPLFSGTITPAEKMFAETFYGTAITSIPDGLFAGIRGAPAESMFSGTFSGSAITSIPANLFGTLNGDGAPSMFERTFYNCKNLTTADGPLFSGTITPAYRMFGDTFSLTALTEIPADLFAGIRGTPADYMFSNTFANTALTEIPADLFAGIRGAPAERMFSGTFSDTALTEIPADLFADIQGAPADSMFSSTFRNTAITSIPANLFGTLNGDGAPDMFNGTFYNCENLTTIEGPLFNGTITPAYRMFGDTFSFTALTEIPADLFAGIRGTPADYMFSNTFANTALTEIPADLFAGIQGAPAESMFGTTFSGCSELQSIPENLFAGIQGAPAESMFYGTFANSAITEIPADLFAGIRGAPADSMFSSTFHMCSELQSIPENLFAGISGPAASRMFELTFAYCTSLTGPSARINGQYLYEIWPNSTRNMDTYENATGLSDYDQIPDKWK